MAEAIAVVIPGWDRKWHFWEPRLPNCVESCVPDFGETIMVRVLTAAAILGLLLAPPLGAQTSRPCANGGPAAATAPKDILDKQDDTFIKQAAAGGMAEVELSKIAEKSANTEIKLFAERIVRDHTAANIELTDIATTLCAEVPTTLDTDHQRIRDQLRTAHGGALDQQYMHVMVADHDQDVHILLIKRPTVSRAQL